MKRFPSFLSLVLAATGCAAPQRPVAPLVTATASPPSLEKRSDPPPAPPVAATVPPATRQNGLSVAYGLARAEEWADLPVASATRMRKWTPDAFIGNRVTDAKIAFASVPAVIGTPSQVAEGIRAQMDGTTAKADVVMSDVSGKRASFTFESPEDGRRGKIVITRVPGLDSQYVMLVGEWPADADAVSVADIDGIARSINASPAP